MRNNRFRARVGEKPEVARWKQLYQKFPILKHNGGPAPPPPADFKMSDLAIDMWHFPKSKTEELRSQAMSQTGVSWISTYDAIMSILWKIITRSKLELLQSEVDRRGHPFARGEYEKGI